MKDERNKPDSDRGDTPGPDNPPRGDAPDKDAKRKPHPDPQKLPRRDGPGMDR